MNRTKIEWVKNPDGTQGYTWNPITGCLNGCEYCYAKKLANTKLRTRYLANRILAPVNPPDLRAAITNPFYPRAWFNRREPALESKKPKGIFVCDMSDLFGIGIPEEWTRHVLNLITLTPQHRFYLLTKQPQNLIKFSPFPENCWVGVSATTDKQYMSALKGLLDIQAKVRFLSFEPLLEEVINNQRDHGFCNLLAYSLINQVIIGACTGQPKELMELQMKYPDLEPVRYGKKLTLQPKIKYVEEIVEACDKASVAVFQKDNLKPLLTSLRQELPR